MYVMGKQQSQCDDQQRQRNECKCYLCFRFLLLAVRLRGSYREVVDDAGELVEQKKYYRQRTHTTTKTNVSANEVNHAHIN